MSQQEGYARLLTSEPGLLERLQPTSTSAIRTWDEVPDILTMPTASIEWIVDGIIPKGSLALLAGDPGTYKTWLALGMLRGIAHRPVSCI
jgi:predicted ATP-dependent serine protease